MRFEVTAEVTGLAQIADPEGATIERALPALGFDGVSAMRVGKVFRFTLEATDPDRAREESERLCERLLANPVIERYDLFIERTTE